MNGPASRFRILPYLLAFFSSLCIMVLELVASRLVARHVGASLDVWTSVIGIMLGGICLGNVLGGRLADRADPSRVIGPLYALGAALTLGSLWLNALGGYIPQEGIPSWLRTVMLVSIDFLIPGTLLGMIGPVVAKLAVEQARRAGSAIGDVYTLGAIGSIAGTFLCGFYLMPAVSITTIITLVAAALVFMSALLIGDAIGLVIGLVASTLLGLSAIDPVVQALPLNGTILGAIPVRNVLVGGIRINPLALLGHFATLSLAVVALVRLVQARLPEETPAEDTIGESGPSRPKLGDLAALSFLISLAFMGFEMAAGRLVTRHLGSSIYGWTSIIGVLLGGLSIGNFLGGKIADKISNEKQSSWLFLVASALLLSVLFLEAPPKWLVSNPIGYWFKGQDRIPLIASGSILSNAIGMTGVSWGWRLFRVITMAFFLPSIALGTVSPVLAKLAIDRVKRTKRTGGAIGVVYAWGMVGSILGTFLTGFLLIDVLGTKGVLLLLATVLALAATIIGTTWHAIWAGIPLGLCIITFVPMPFLQTQGEKWGLREPRGNPSTDTEDAVAWIDESNYYYIKVENNKDAEGKKRTLVLDNLIHGYYILDHPERLDYDYEHIYALVADRVERAKAKKEGKPTELDGFSLKLISPLADASGLPTAGKKLVVIANVKDQLHFRLFDADGKVVIDRDEASLAAQAKPVAALKLDLKDLWPSHEPTEGEKGNVLAKVTSIFGRTALDTMFLGGGAYTFQRYILHTYPGSTAEVAEIDPAVLNANKKAIGLEADTPIVTHLGDARQFVERNQDRKQFDIVFGDAFNDFSVPWHLTTREFNDKLAKMLTPDGVYMINIIDVYESDAKALAKAEAKVKKMPQPSPAALEAEKKNEMAFALNNAGFLGSWVKTARQTFPYIYVFGTDDNPGAGFRETFVVVASKTPLDLDILGGRNTDPKFFEHDKLFEPKAYSKKLMDELEVRSRGIVLTDDYAPVENLLAPVAETRGNE